VPELIREAPLETETIDWHGSRIRIPTRAEMLRIKAALMLRRNATRDYLDFVALGDKLGPDVSAETLVQLGEYRRLVPCWRDWAAVRGACAKPAARPFDLLADIQGRRHGFEMKWSEAPKVSRSMRIALEDLELEHLWIIHAGRSSFEVDDRITAWTLRDIGGLLSRIQASTGSGL
jgi:hypothetical protein